MGNDVRAALSVGAVVEDGIAEQHKMTVHRGMTFRIMPGYDRQLSQRYATM